MNSEGEKGGKGEEEKGGGKEEQELPDVIRLKEVKVNIIGIS